jgi:ABC-type multidrug transport system ATPase subunit/pSer/pThr/pTyr-binding forkhead associated (FHA) protein
LDVEISILSGLPPRKEKISRQVVIGRGEEADLILNHPEISPRHCRVIPEAEKWFIEDLGTQNGTAVNGVTISGRTRLSIGDQIRVGPVILAFGAAADPLITPQGATSAGAILLKGRPAEIIPLERKLILGRAGDATVQMNDPTVSRLHASIEKGAAGYQITDLDSRSGLFVNARRSFVHHLIIGDRVQIGPFYFLFDGRNLVRLYRLSVGRLMALDLEKYATSGPILRKSSFIAAPGQFIGILGPSGAGKSTLLNALSGIRPASSGRVLIDGVDFYRNFDALRSRVGYVPQDDIVHSELTVAQALTFAARLRLPAATPQPEIGALVAHTIANLGLSDRVHGRIWQLSGGERKRVNVAVELLSRPLLLFLDEPTSGLDPFSERMTMVLLRQLADTGCTVICTTHVLQNVFLMDQIAVLTKGRVIFQGSVDSAPRAFGVGRLEELFDVLQGIDAEHLPLSVPPVALTVEETKVSEDAPATRPASFSLPILLLRQTALFSADLKNILIALGQPLVIGALVIWVTQEPSAVQYFTCLGTLWFGCSNSAQEVVRELAIYRRERFVGLGRYSYLLNKFLWMGSLTALQALLLFGVVSLGEAGNKGDPWLQMAGLIFLAYAATGIGLTISTLARSAILAVMLVPLVLIPLMLFSGHTIEAKRMSEPVLWVSRIMPSFAAEQIDDVSFFLNRQISALAPSEAIPYNNARLWYRWLGYGDKGFEIGSELKETRPLWVAFLILMTWIVVTFSTSYFLLARKER